MIPLIVRIGCCVLYVRGVLPSISLVVFANTDCKCSNNENYLWNTYNYRKLAGFLLTAVSVYRRYLYRSVPDIRTLYRYRVLPAESTSVSYYYLLRRRTIHQCRFFFFSIFETRFFAHKTIPAVYNSVCIQGATLTHLPPPYIREEILHR